MAIISLKQLLDHALENCYGIPAFNVSNLEQIHAVMEAANYTNSPVILQASLSSINYISPNFIRHLFLSAIEDYFHLPVCIHQDHGTSLLSCQQSINLGFSSVMIDGSLEDDGVTPSNYQYNVDVTRKTVSIAHKYGVSVEGEIGCLGSFETRKSSKEDGIGASGTLSINQLLTDPQEAMSFVNATNVDALAIAIGTSHGINKFSKPPNENNLAIYRIKEIHKLIPSTPLVMHGASSIPQSYLYKINKYGGNISTNNYGVPISEILIAIKHGVCKINIDTDLRIAATGSIREFMALHNSVFDMRKYNYAAKQSMIEICKSRYNLFGSAGMASKIKPIPLKEISKMYD